MPIYLASGSPRRKDLLEKEGLSFEVMVSRIEEVPWPEEQPASFALRNLVGSDVVASAGANGSMTITL